MSSNKLVKKLLIAYDFFLLNKKKYIEKLL